MRFIWKEGIGPYIWVQEVLCFLYLLHKDYDINGEYYASLLRQLRKHVKTRRSGKQTKSVLFLRSNGQADMSFIAGCDFELVDHSFFCPSWTAEPSNCHMFFKMKNLVRNQCLLLMIFEQPDEKLLRSMQLELCRNNSPFPSIITLREAMELHFIKNNFKSYY